MLQFLRIEFHPQEDGSILCRRFRDKMEVNPITYPPNSSMPLGLNLSQKREWEDAVTLIKECKA